MIKKNKKSREEEGDPPFVHFYLERWQQSSLGVPESWGHLPLSSFSYLCIVSYIPLTQILTPFSPISHLPYTSFIFPITIFSPIRVSFSPPFPLVPRICLSFRPPHSPPHPPFRIKICEEKGEEGRSWSWGGNKGWVGGWILLTG